MRSVSSVALSAGGIIMKSIGEMIAFLRKEKGMTQNQLAEKMNVTDKAVSKWERDLSCPDVNTISKLADVLDVSVEELLKAKKKDYSSVKIKKLIDLIFKAVALAMGIAVIVLNILDQVDIKTSVIMLGIGLFCLSIYLLDGNENKNQNQ